MDKKRLRKLAGINELAGDPVDWGGDPDPERPEGNKKLIQGLRSALEQLDAGRPDAARYYLIEMLKHLQHH